MADSLTEAIIGAAIEVHRILGPGLMEIIYEKALCHELELRRLSYRTQVRSMRFIKEKLFEDSVWTC